MCHTKFGILTFSDSTNTKSQELVCESGGPSLLVLVLIWKPNGWALAAELLSLGFDVHEAPTGTYRLSPLQPAPVLTQWHHVEKLEAHRTAAVKMQ